MIEVIFLVAAVILSLCFYYRVFHDVGDDYYIADRVENAVAQRKLNEKKLGSGGRRSEATEG